MRRSPWRGAAGKRGDYPPTPAALSTRRSGAAGHAFEVLAIGAGGTQSISEGVFTLD
jgi:hypothetical protein